MSQPLISIITPSFNQGKYLEETILSIHNQTYSNFEHIIIDGSSTDDSVQIIKKYSNKLKYWISEKDEGQAHAINKGLMKSSGQIMTWINSDDILEPNALQIVADFFIQHPETLILHGKSILFGDDIHAKIVGENKSNLHHRYLAYIPFPQPSSFFHRRLIDESGYLDERLHYGMDYELLLRAATRGKVRFFDEIISRYRIHKESKTNNHLLFASEWNSIFSKFLNSTTLSKKYIEILTDINLYQFSNEKFDIKIKLSEQDIELAVLYHLLIQFHYYYQANDFSFALNIAHAIKKISPNFFKEENLHYQCLKAKYVPSLILTLFRRVTRKLYFD